MQRLVSLFCILLTVFPAVGQSTSKYQVGTITEVKVHQTAGSGPLTPRAMTFRSRWSTQFMWCYVRHHWARRP